MKDQEESEEWGGGEVGMKERVAAWGGSLNGDQ